MLALVLFPSRVRDCVALYRRVMLAGHCCTRSIDHFRSSWSKRRPKDFGRPSPRSSLADAFTLSDLPNVQQWLQTRPEARPLAAEAVAGQRQRVLRIFFESVEFALAEMMLPHNEQAPSVHQLGRAAFFEMIADKSAKLSTLGRARCIVVRREDSGFFSGFLVALDALLFAPPDAEV